MAHIGTTLTKAGFNKGSNSKINNSLGKYIKTNKLIKINKQFNSGVYKLKYGASDKVYIARNLRKFEIHHYEHFNSFIIKKETQIVLTILIKNSVLI